MHNKIKFIKDTVILANIIIYTNNKETILSQNIKTMTLHNITNCNVREKTVMKQGYFISCLTFTQ